MIKKIIIAFIILFLLLVVAVLVVPKLISAEVYEEQLLKMVERKTGYHIEVKGASKFILFPDLAIALEKIVISSQNQAQEDIVTADKLIFNVKLASLLKGMIEVQELQLVKPYLNLQVDEEGKKNWQHIKASTEKNDKPSKSTAISKKNQEQVIQNGKKKYVLQLNSVVIKDGTLQYSNEQERKKKYILSMCVYLHINTVHVKRFNPRKKKEILTLENLFNISQNE